VVTVDGFEGVEKAAAEHEAREAVGGAQRRPGSRTSEIKSALMRYLASEQYRESVVSTHRADDDERRGSDEEA
jgi:hypothetical protein